MSDELEQKRREKIESFKVEFQDDFDDISSSDPVAEDNPDEPKDYSINIDSGIDSSGEVEEIFANVEGGEINSHSGAPDEVEQKLDSHEMRVAKRKDKRRRRFKARKNRLIFRAIWLTMVIFTSPGILLKIAVTVTLLAGIVNEFSVTSTSASSASFTVNLSSS